ncbi:dihydrofolate reductase [Opitutaceae bacterium TAV1]|nr:dihydrofolate reductase [Opitutaceae bacterium TAV1]
MVVTLLAAQSLDGWITRHGKGGDSFTSEDDKIHFRQFLRESDACIMGRVTWEASRERLRIEARPDLRRVVLTREPGRHAAEARVGVGAGVVGEAGRAPLAFTDEEPAQVVRRLREAGVQRCALLGGGQVYGAFLAAGLVDEISVTIEPRIFGSGTPLASGPTRGADGAGAVGREFLLDVRLELVKAALLGASGAVEMRYRVRR